MNTPRKTRSARFSPQEAKKHAGRPFMFLESPHASDVPVSPHREPKLLPWLGRKAGISESRRLILWQDACRHAAYRAEPESSLYFKIAIDRLLELVAAESLREDAASFGWRPWARAQRRFWSAVVHAYESGCLLTTRSIRTLTALQAKA